MLIRERLRGNIIRKYNMIELQSFILIYLKYDM